MDINWQEVMGWSGQTLEDLQAVAYYYAKNGQYEIAKQFFDALIVLDPNNVYNLKTLGALYLQLGDYISALNMLERALRLDQSDPYIKLNRAKALLHLGYKRQGIMQAQELVNDAIKSIAESAQVLLEMHL